MASDVSSKLGTNFVSPYAHIPNFLTPLEANAFASRRIYPAWKGTWYSHAPRVEQRKILWSHAFSKPASKHWRVTNLATGFVKLRAGRFCAIDAVDGEGMEISPSVPPVVGEQAGRSAWLHCQVATTLNSSCHCMLIVPIFWTTVKHH
jgi:hypothetical protein